MAAHSAIQMQLAKLIRPYCRTSEGVVAIVHALAWNMLCVLNATGMSHNDIMECVSNSINRASVALADVKRREQQRKGKYGSE
jgi:hypothetical protein